MPDAAAKIRETATELGALEYRFKKLAAAYKALYIAANMLADEMKSTPGGDAYEFDGSSNLVDALRGQLDRIEADKMLAEIAYPGIGKE